MKSRMITRLFPSVIITILLIGCGSQNNIITPPVEKNIEKSTLMNDGYDLILDQASGKVELIQRDASYDVTHSFSIKLVKYKWDSAQHLLYATIEMQNLVDMCYWGVRLVFDNTGGRWVINSDGYAYYELGHSPPAKRMPFITYNRDTYHRSMTSLDKDSREIIAYCPAGVGSIHFWIDAVNTWERDEPIVEEQFCRKGKAFSDYAVTAFCYDFQSHHIRSPRGDINELKVWADLTKVGGPPDATMYDDGMHYDYEAKDHIYGVSFVPSGDYGMTTIYCEDSDGNISENDVAFIRHYTLLEHTPKSIERGLWSELAGPHYEIIRDGSRWEAFWAEHKGGPIPAPPVDFTHEMVLVAIAGMAGGGQWIEINHVFENTKRHLEIQASIWNGSKGCILPLLLTNAYDIVSMPINNLLPEPKLRKKMFYCDEQLPYLVVSSGDFSGIHDAREVIINDWQSWETLWYEHSGSTEPPSIDFSDNTVAAVFLGDRELDDTYVKLDRVMTYQSPLREIYYSEHYPGYGCELASLDCQPYVIIVFAKDNTVDYSFHKRMVPDDCV